MSTSDEQARAAKRRIDTVAAGCATNDRAHTSLSSDHQGPRCWVESQKCVIDGQLAVKGRDVGEVWKSCCSDGTVGFPDDPAELNARRCLGSRMGFGVDRVAPGWPKRGIGPFL